jgi:hypothetical protein
MIDSRKAYEAMRNDLGQMRGELKRLEGLGLPVVTRITTAIRVTMMDMASRVTELESNEAARRMCGDVPALQPQAPVDELPIFARATQDGHVLTADEIEAMAAFRHREGDHTQDKEGDA